MYMVLYNLTQYTSHILTTAFFQINWSNVINLEMSARLFYANSKSVLNLYY